MKRSRASSGGARSQRADWLTQGGTTLIASPQPHAGDGLVLQVLELLRYALDGEWFAATGETLRPECGDAFDVVVSDGIFKRKVTLSTTLNYHVYCGWLRPLAVVRVAAWRIVHDELHLPAPDEPSPPLIVVTRLAAAPKIGEDALPAAPHVARGVITSQANLLQPKHATGLEALARSHNGEYDFARHVEPLPLFGARRHYLHIDSDDVRPLCAWWFG